MDTVTETTSEANGVATEAKIEDSPSMTEKMGEVKPWIAAGFKSRAEWRASKKPVKEKMSAESPKPVKAKVEKPVKVKPAKKPAKPKVKATTKSAAKPKTKKPKTKKPKTTYMKKHKYPTTAAERRKSAERTAAFMKAAGKREEPNEDEAKLLRAAKVGGTTSIEKMAFLFSGASAKRKSRVRNALRWCVASKHFKRLGGGEYKRLK